MAGGMMPMMGSHDPTSVDGARPFDKAFIEEMIPHHQMAVMGSTMALQRIERPELRELLQSIITSQSAEIAQMRDWYLQWYGMPVSDEHGTAGHGTGPATGGMIGHPMAGHTGGKVSQAMDHAQMMGRMGGSAGHGIERHGAQPSLSASTTEESR
jgi:hypothetical protein